MPAGKENFSSQFCQQPEQTAFFIRENFRRILSFLAEKGRGGRKRKRVSLGIPEVRHGNLIGTWTFLRNSCERLSSPRVNHSTVGFCWQLGWVCQYDALPTIAQSIFFVGAIFGGLIFGWIADQYGRIPALIGANLMGFLAGVATAFTDTFWQFTLCRFFVGFAFDNCFTMMYILGNYFFFVEEVHSLFQKLPLTNFCHYIVARCINS